MENRLELWIDFVGLADCLWESNDKLCFSKDYERNVKFRDSSWLTVARQTLRGLGYKIIKWETLFYDKDCKYIKSEHFTTDCPMVIYEQEGSGQWNDWIDDVGDCECAGSESNSDSDSDSEDAPSTATSEDPSD